MSESAKILLQATESFSTIQQILDASKRTLPPADRRVVRASIVEDTKKARASINGKKMITSVEGRVSKQEENCVRRLNAMFDSFENDDTEEMDKK